MPVFGGVGASQTVSIANGGRVNFLNQVSTTPGFCCGVVPARAKLTFHNPGTVDCFVAPQFTQNNGFNVLLVPSINALGGCFLVFANGGTLIIEGECQGAWQVFAREGTTNPFTVMESNIA